VISVSFAQEASVKSSRASAPTVTVTASPEFVRFTAPGNTTAMRVEVYSDEGERLFDSAEHAGNVFDWPLHDARADRLGDGSYLCVVTVKNLSGKVNQKLGIFVVHEKQLVVQAIGPSQLTPRQSEALSQSLAASDQAQAVGSLEDASALTLVSEGEPDAVTTMAHDGTNAEIGRSRGALSFRLGDFFSGKDKEQMRLTEDGRLGIGTDNPQATLDVAGTIRAGKGFEFADGTVQTTGLSGRKDKDGNIVPAVAGTGSTNRVAKWIDTVGTLGDSLLNESGNTIELRALSGSGVNPTFTNPNNVPGFSQFTFYPSAGPNTNMSFSAIPRGNGAANNRAQISVFRTDLIADPNNYEFAALRARDTDFVFGTGRLGTGVNRPFMLASGFLTDNTTNNGQLYLATNGNVGINTTSPGTKLDVAGDINTTTQYNIGGNRLFSIPGTNNTFIGLNSGNANTTGTSNTFAGFNSGPGNTTGTSNSFFGGAAGQANTTGSMNSFFGRSAGSGNTTGSNNSFFGHFAGQNNAASSNAFFGSSAGAANTSGNLNAFFGETAGVSNTTGSNNSFFGRAAGAGNTTGSNNSFFGNAAGTLNSTGTENSFFGKSAGGANTTGARNSFFGKDAGAANTTAVNNSFFGQAAGAANTTGASNSFFGATAGQANTTGNNNAFFGEEAGNANTTGGDNSFFGVIAGLSNTAGAGNSFFGRNTGANNTTGGNNSFFGIQAGEHTTTGSSNSFFGSFAGQLNATGNDNSFFGLNAGHGNTEGGTNSFFGRNAGQLNTEGASNTFVGYNSGQSNTTESSNTFIGANSNGALGITNATAIGANASVTQSDSLVLGSDANVGVGASAPKEKLHVVGNIFIGGNPAMGANGLILKSPNGATCAKLTIDNAGVLVTTILACP